MRPITFLALLFLTSAAPRWHPASYVIQPGQIDLAKGPDGNTVILDAPQGLIVVDTGRHPEHAQAIIDYAQKVGKPVVAVINTHWHLDHTTGNRDVLAAFPGAKIVASRAVDGALGGFLARSRTQGEKALEEGKLDPEAKARTERALAAMNDRAAIIPGVAIVRNGPMRLGGRPLQFHLASNAATEGDVWFVSPDEKLAVVGDLVVAQVPFFDTGCEKGWAKALDAIAQARWTVLIPGHGAPMNRAQFDRWHRAFTRFVDCAHSDRAAQACASQWQEDAAGFYAPAERDEVGLLARYYINEVLRAPAEKRMPYCRIGPFIFGSRLQT